MNLIDKYRKTVNAFLYIKWLVYIKYMCKNKSKTIAKTQSIEKKCLYTVKSDNLKLKKKKEKSKRKPKNF